MEYIIDYERGEINGYVTGKILSRYQHLFKAILRRYNSKSGRFINFTFPNTYTRGNAPGQSNGRDFASETGTTGNRKYRQYQNRENIEDLKNAQFKIIQETNPMTDDYHVGIRSPKDILTFEETLDDEDNFAWGDFDLEDAKKAVEQGEIRIYSSYPIENGVFVSTSYQQALEYAGMEPENVHSKIVPLNSVAWINGDEGQYAKTNELNETEYLNAVKNGDIKTAQRLVDETAKENGYTVKAYHGTPNGTFNVFKDWQYFTETKWYADWYQYQGASTNYKKTANNPKTYEVYLKLNKLFDTRKASSNSGLACFLCK